MGFEKKANIDSYAKVRLWGALPLCSAPSGASCSRNRLHLFVGSCTESTFMADSRRNVCCPLSNFPVDSSNRMRLACEFLPSPPRYIHALLCFLKMQTTQFILLSRMIPSGHGEWTGCSKSLHFSCHKTELLKPNDCPICMSPLPTLCQNTLRMSINVTKAAGLPGVRFQADS